MTAPTASYLQVFYDLRPAKQVERRMIIDVLQRLASVGFYLRDYQYTGLGSIYFVDFILFHRLLGLRRLLSVEYDTRIRKRVKFNQPFGLVDIEMKPVGDVIPILDEELRHLLWLDYDRHLDSAVVADTSMAGFRLSPGSVLLVTVDLKQPPAREDPAACMEYYREHAGTYFDAGWTASDFTLSALPTTVSRILLKAVWNGMSGRSTKFLSLFRFVYADGTHPMLTIGGMIGTTNEEQLLKPLDLSDVNFVRRDDVSAPYEIVVPRLTRKERMYLDQLMPCADGWTPPDFELTADEAHHYRDIYRYYPWYAELLL